MDSTDSQPDGGTRAGAASPGRLSRSERLGLVLHRLLDRWLSPLGVWIYRRTKGGVAKPWKVDALLLTTRGRRTGRDRTVVLQYFTDADAAHGAGEMIVTAANDGGDAYPAWYLNLRAEPRARVEVNGQAIAVEARELAADEASAWWSRIVARDPSYARFRLATDRPFPVLRLAHVGGDAR